MLFDQEILDKSNVSLKGGRLGVFTYSQPKVKWSALKYRFELIKSSRPTFKYEYF